jgi:hypothetical protein
LKGNDMMYEKTTMRLGLKCDGRMRYGLMIDLNNYGTKFVGLFWRGEAFVSAMSWSDGTAIATLGRRRWHNFGGSWARDTIGQRK